MRKHWLIGGLAGVLALVAGLAFVQFQDAQTLAQAEDPEGYASGQPIAFPHNQHAGVEEGQNQMSCQYCHFSAERSYSAGLPPVETCMGCHQVVEGADEAAQAEIDKLQGYWERGESIPWVRIYKISDHAKFPHMRHVNAGLECADCHGDVQNMEVINSRAPAWGGDNMGWCIDCHRDSDATIDCSACHY